MKDGSQISEEDKVSDPVAEIGIGVAKRLESAYGSCLVSPPVADGKIAGIPVAKLVIEVKAINRGLWYFGLDDMQCGLPCCATVQLADRQLGHVVASGYCKRNASALKTYTDQLLTGSAAGLKTGLSGVADDCVKFKSTQILTM